MRDLHECKFEMLCNYLILPDDLEWTNTKKISSNNSNYTVIKAIFDNNEPKDALFWIIVFDLFIMEYRYTKILVN